MYNTISAESFDYNVFGAIVDVVPPGGRRDGLSYLWTSTPITLDKQHSSERVPHTNESGTHSDSTHSHSHGGDLEVVQGRFISRGGEQWSLNPQFVTLNFRQKRTIKMQSASTIFETETESMMVAREVGEEAKMYTSMTLNIPHKLKLEPVKAESALEFLPNKSARPGESADMYVTSSKDNIIRTINDRPASSFLEDSLAAGLFLDPVPPMNTRFTKNLENPKNRSVYALINDSVRYKVIAGGGGWGVRAGMLVLDPEAKVPANAKIEFYVTKNAGPDYGIADAELMTGDQSYGRVYFECVEPIQFLDDAEAEAEGAVVEEVALEGIFGAGTDNRFLVGTKKYDVHGEFVAASVVK
ncbi:hypothetical protein BZA70DRAFT_266586 [Myxozyma melibiosi]|uniref:Uncharacterized protein n=1 Tax=Myxozyma melibiosi TaxID=54550 RepID=A0ABR1F8V4_9ASCO